MAIITLTTDFGTRDPYVGVMKGVILGIAPGASLVDLTHEVPPQDVMAGAMALEAGVRYFPPGTIHLAVVDPGVGSARDPIAVETERALFVGPDNGLFTAVLERMHLCRAVRLTDPRFFMPEVSATFHGRDVFAPVAAHLAAGVPLADLGEPEEDIQSLDLPRPIIHGHTLEAHVIHVDHFGNLVTDLTDEGLRAFHPGPEDGIVILVRGTMIEGLRRTFSDVRYGEPVAYIGSGGRLEIAVRDGSAMHELGAVPGTTITLHPNT